MSAGFAGGDDAAFRDYLAARGCAQVGIVEWEPGRVSPEHVHAFTAVGLVLAGGFTLRTAAGTRTLGVGEHFELPAGTPHVEDVGPTGARLLSGRLAPS